MNSKLDQDSRDSLIKYRIQRAFETLVEADYTAKGNFYNSAVNRLYYSVFYAACAALVSKEIQCNTHSGVKSMFSLHFIRTGILGNEYGKIFNELFQNRMAGDYEDFVYCDEEQYKNLRPKAEAFIRTIQVLLSNSDEKTK